MLFQFIDSVGLDCLRCEPGCLKDVIREKNQGALGEFWAVQLDCGRRTTISKAPNHCKEGCSDSDFGGSLHEIKYDSHISPAAVRNLERNDTVTKKSTRYHVRDFYTYLLAH